MYLSWRALDPRPPPQCAYPGVTTMKRLTPSHDKTKHGTWRCADNMQFLEGLARSVHSHALAPARNSHARLELARAPAARAAQPTDATASCAGVLLMLQAMIDKPARNSTRATMAFTSEENKGSGVATSVATLSPPSMEASSDKRTREAPDTTTKPL